MALLECITTYCFQSAVMGDGQFQSGCQLCTVSHWHYAAKYILLGRAAPPGALALNKRMLRACLCFTYIQNCLSFVGLFLVWEYNINMFDISDTFDGFIHHSFYPKIWICVQYKTSVAHGTENVKKCILIFPSIRSNLMMGHSTFRFGNPISEDYFVIYLKS